MMQFQKTSGRSGKDPVDSGVDSEDQHTEVYKEQFGTRFIVRCDDFKLRLQANIADDGQPEKLDNVHFCFLIINNR